jgi:hypothetical protein
MSEIASLGLNRENVGESQAAVFYPSATLEEVCDFPPDRNDNAPAIWAEQVISEMNGSQWKKFRSF